MTSGITRKTIMEDDKIQPLLDRKHRSFVISDFSVRDIPVALLAFAMISIASVVLGLAVESLPSFCRGFLFGFAVTLAAVVGLSLLLRKKDR